MTHVSAQPNHYDASAKHYDEFNEINSKTINETIERVLKSHSVKTVLDLTCGTGAQVFWLMEQGYQVTGVDINSRMLEVAVHKAQQVQLEIDFLLGDMRTTQLGQFDAVLTIFNAVGHLTKDDFATALDNIHRNLVAGGLYIFDIFNLEHLLADKNITKLTIDWLEYSGDTTTREIQYSTISHDGVLASYTTEIEQLGHEEPSVVQSNQTLQVYTAEQLRDLLQQAGFKCLAQTNVDGSAFEPINSERILTIARKEQ